MDLSTNLRKVSLSSIFTGIFDSLWNGNLRSPSFAKMVKPYDFAIPHEVLGGINFSKKQIGCYRPVAALSDWFDQKSLTMMSKKKISDLHPA